MIPSKTKLATKVKSTVTIWIYLLFTDNSNFVKLDYTRLEVKFIGSVQNNVVRIIIIILERVYLITVLADNT